MGKHHSGGHFHFFHWPKFTIDLNDAGIRAWEKASWRFFEPGDPYFEAAAELIYDPPGHDLDPAAADYIYFAPPYRAEIDGWSEDGGTPVNGFIVGGHGKDTINGGDGEDTLLGGNGRDELNGGEGDDLLIGGLGKDKLHGGEGNDTLDGGLGKDLLDGGDGEDTALYLGNFEDYKIDCAGDGFVVSKAGHHPFLHNSDYLVDVEKIEFQGDGTTVWLVAEGQSIQAAVDAAQEGDTIFIGCGIFAESVSVDKALHFIGAGPGETIIAPPGGSGFDLVGDLGSGATVSFDGLSILGAADYGIEVNGTTLGTLEIHDTHFEGNGRNGLGIVNGLNLGAVVVAGSSFTENGFPHASSGDGDLLFYQFNGDATLSELTIDGGSRPIDGGSHDAGHAAENAIQFRSDSGSLGNVTIEDVQISGAYEKVGIAFYNYDDVDGLYMEDVDVTADSGWNLSLNFDGIAGDIDISGFPGLSYSQVAALQGDLAEANLFIGGNGSDALNGKDGDDALQGNGGNDTLNGGDGSDTGIYSGTLADYDVTFGVGVITVDGPDGIDQLIGVEKLQFLGDGVCVWLVAAGQSIQDAVDAAAPGDTVLVGPGTYNENVTIDKAITLLSAEGRGSTVIQGSEAPGSLGTVMVTGNTDGVEIGAADHGFTLIGYDVANPGLEHAALYFQGPHANARIVGNDIQADGEAGMLTEYGFAISGFEIIGNIFSGQTFVGTEVANADFSQQFTVHNVPRALLYISGSGKSDITFQDNEVTGTAGAEKEISGDPFGNILVTIDAENSSITGNTFSGFTYNAALRVRDTGTDIENNTFDNSGGGNTTGVVMTVDDGSYTGNEFIGGADPDIFVGTPGDDSLSGGGNDDILVGMGGADTLVGGAGNDTFVYTSTADAGDLIDGFDAAAADLVDLDLLLDELGIATADRSARVDVDQVGSDGTVAVDTTGDASFDLLVVTLEDVTGTLDLGDVNLGSL
ncbi:hypothetical protein [Pelagibius marinus]|uniref:hypothetical protein n=1 Tax=Pelagibius marinus TaxID=2762760 RepID=UPI0018732B94|nr:hypothetical protein [Pelagibius marinus]